MCQCGILQLVTLRLNHFCSWGCYYIYMTLWVLKSMYIYLFILNIYGDYLLLTF